MADGGVGTDVPTRSSAAAGPGTARRGRVRDWADWGLPALAVVGFLVAGWQRRWTADDAFINFRVVRQVLAGNGPVFNAGERVEATTSTLWVAVVGVVEVVSPLAIEWDGLLTGLVLGAVGMATGMAGALAIDRLRTAPTGPEPCRGEPAAPAVTGAGGRADRPGAGVVVPVGAATYLGASGAWDWATGGLENGLSLAWLGGSTWAVVALLAASAPTRRRLVATSALVGLGALVRPDLAVFTVGLAPAVAAAAWRRGGRRSVAAAAAAALAVPAVVQVCRMGYYAQLVPTSVTAKEGMQPSWRNGVDYLADFATASHLVVPLAVVLAWLAASWRGSGRDWRLVVAGIEVAAVAHTLGIVRAGGDYMHARLLLPAWFAALLPVFAVRLAGRAQAASPAATHRWRAAGVAVLAAWVLVAAGWLRPDGSRDIRTGLVAVATPHPVTARDIVGRQPFLGYASTLGNRPGYHEQGLEGTVVTTPSAGGRSVTSTEVLGIVGYTAPVDVVVHDRLGLADPVTAHLALDRRGRPGHEKMLPGSWIAALFVAPGARVPGDFEQPDGMAAFAAGVDVTQDPARFATERAAATDALGCGELAELLHDTQAPLTPGRFLGNIADAPRLHGFRFPVDPDEARARLCT